jgi:hypothetical protein
MSEYRPEWADAACQVCKGTGFVTGPYLNLSARFDAEGAEPCESCGPTA